MGSPRDLYVPLLLAAATVACQEQRVEPELPDALLGLWTTQEPRYADRFFELRRDRTIRFGQGEAGVNVSPVTGVEIDRDGNTLIFRIEHLNEVGDSYTLSLRYDPARADQLTLVHQPFVVWKRSPGSPRTSR